MAHISIYGRIGDTEGNRNKNEDSQSHVGRQPASAFGRSLVNKYGNKFLFNGNKPIVGPLGLEIIQEFDNPIRAETDAELLKVLKESIFSLGLSVYGDRIVKHFASKSGKNLQFTMDNWYDGTTNKKEFLKAIVNGLNQKHDLFHSTAPVCKFIDISKEIKNYKPNFRKSFLANLSETIAMGGVQEVVVEGTKVKDLGHGPNYWQSGGKFTFGSRAQNIPHLVEIKLKITFKDWFGVNEDDFTSLTRPAVIAGRTGLTKMWILQHQRGYPPFILELVYHHRFIAKLWRTGHPVN